MILVDISSKPPNLCAIIQLMGVKVRNAVFAWKDYMTIGSKVFMLSSQQEIRHKIRLEELHNDKAENAVYI